MLPMEPIIDLRSDTVTQPTPAMRRAMADGRGRRRRLRRGPDRQPPRGAGRRAARARGRAVRALRHDGQPDRHPPPLPARAARSSARPAPTSSTSRWGRWLRSRAPSRARSQTPAGSCTPEQLRAGYPARGGLPQLRPRCSCSRTPTTSPAAGSRRPRGWPSWWRPPARRGLPVHLDGARILNAAAALGVPAGARSRAAATRSCSAFPRASARRSARCWSATAS